MQHVKTGLWILNVWLMKKSQCLVQTSMFDGQICGGVHQYSVMAQTIKPRLVDWDIFFRIVIK